MVKRLGEMLLEAGLINQEQLDEGLARQEASGLTLGSNLMELGFVKEEDVSGLLSQQFGAPGINLSQLAIDSRITRRIPWNVCHGYQVLPVRLEGKTLILAMIDPTNVFAIDDVKFLTGCDIRPVVAVQVALQKAIERHYGTTSEKPEKILDALEIIDSKEDPTTSEKLEEILDELETVDTEEDLDAGEEIDLAASSASAEAAPVNRLVDFVIMDAVRRAASDIHVEPFERQYRVRFRIDGLLHAVMSLPLKLKEVIPLRIKSMAKLDIAKRKLPQVGQIDVKTRRSGEPKIVSYRVSVLPTPFGERCVLRLLDRDDLVLDMTKLGLEPEALEMFERAIRRPQGMVLVAGPGGSGKTNTLYSALSRLNTTETNILTAEDPVELHIPGISQVSIREDIGLTYSACLEAFLTQDPDVIMVGEIRDPATAEAAVKAVLSGRLVLSTLHTSDTPSTVNRLVDLGVEPSLVAASVHLVCAQRLVRRLCTHCKVASQKPPQVLIEMGFSPEEATEVQLYEGEGCLECGNTGYDGRIGLFELLEVTDPIRELIVGRSSVRRLRNEAVESGMISLRRRGLQRIRDGITTVDEVLRETVS